MARDFLRTVERCFMRSNGHEQRQKPFSREDENTVDAPTSFHYSTVPIQKRHARVACA